MKNYDYELLKQLYSIHSPSGSEKKMRKFLKRYCTALGAKCVQDGTGNLLVTKGESETYPCICAHMDQVQKSHSKDFQIIHTNGVVLGFSAKSKSQQGLGADDKNGIWIALQILQRVDAVKCAFFVGEEIGCVGSSAVDLEFFKDCRFCLQADRRNGYDFITDICGSLCSQEFLADTQFAKFGYQEEHGLTTDVGTLVERGVGISCVNMSCGYYHPHTDHECTYLPELENCLALAMHIVERCTKVYPHEYEDVYESYSSYYWYGYGYGKKMSKDDEYMSDWDTMYDLLEQEPWLTFDDVKKNYDSRFISDEEDLRLIYNEIVDYIWDQASTYPVETETNKK